MTRQGRGPDRTDSGSDRTWKGKELRSLDTGVEVGEEHHDLGCGMVER